MEHRGDDWIVVSENGALQIIHFRFGFLLNHPALSWCIKGKHGKPPRPSPRIYAIAYTGHQQLILQGHRGLQERSAQSITFRFSEVFQRSTRSPEPQGPSLGDLDDVNVMHGMFLNVRLFLPSEMVDIHMIIIK